MCMMGLIIRIVQGLLIGELIISEIKFIHTSPVVSFSDQPVQ